MVVSLRAVAPLLLLALALVPVACDDDDDGSNGGRQPDSREVEETRSSDDGKAPQGRRVLRDLPKSEPRGRGERVERIIGTEDLSIEEYLRLVIEDSAAFWASEFEEAGYQFDGVEYATVTAENEPWPAGCQIGDFFADGSNAGGDLIGPFYCPLNETVVYLPTGWLVDEAYGMQGREFAVAFVVAHEVGHHVQNLLGTLEARVRGRVTSRQTELQADCLAGVWARTIYDRNLLEGNDLDEAVGLASEIGDVPGTPLEVAHGSAEERISWFTRGFETGDPSCNTFSQ